MHILYREQEKSPKIVLEIRNRAEVEKKVKLRRAPPTEAELETISKMQARKVNIADPLDLDKKMFEAIQKHIGRNGPRAGIRIDVSKASRADIRKLRDKIRTLQQLAIKYPSATHNVFFDGDEAYRAMRK